MNEVLAKVEISRLEEALCYNNRSEDDTAIIAKTQEELQDMVNWLVDTGRKYGMEINTDKPQEMRVSRSNEALWIKVFNRELK